MHPPALYLLCIAGVVHSAAPSDLGTSLPVPGSHADAAGSAAAHAASSGAADRAAAGTSCPGAGDCCAAGGNGSPGCEDPICCGTVCALDPFCCSIWWDGVCASLAETHCTDLCGDHPACPGDGDCCTENGTPGCEIAFCCDLVCPQVPSCCETGWSQTCADLAEILCPDDCPALPIACPGSGDCCTANGTPGCDDECCCAAVCSDAQFESCCTTAWTQECADAAATMCPGSCAPPEPGCPGEGSCFEGHPPGQTGCDDEVCCSLVCATDDYCCTVRWDTVCAVRAGELCTCLPRICPGDGDCCTANGTPGCTDAPCCDIVCQEDPRCCVSAGVWDDACANLAANYCTDLCQFCGDAIIQGTEECDGGHCCDDDCTITASGVVCRPAGGECDVADVCDGSSYSCPPDAKATSVCRPSTGPCDPLEACDGASDTCPNDVLITECSSDVADHCCPSDCHANSDADCDPTCGNGVRESGEECDDGNTDETDACTVACRTRQPVPALSHWGLLTLALLVLVGAKVTGKRGVSPPGGR